MSAEVTSQNFQFLSACDVQFVRVTALDVAMERLNVVAFEQGQAAHLLDHLDQGLLVKACRGELVPQDPNDEPTEKLLERVRAARIAKQKVRRRRASRSQKVARA